MTTPRVTVPVEPTEAMLDAWHKAVEAGIFSQTPHPDYMREAYRAMLSAAPAPEGGAASELIEAAEDCLRLGRSTGEDTPENRKRARAQYRLNQLTTPKNIIAALASRAPACKTCGGKGYTQHEGGEGEGHPSRPEIEACACRAGEIDLYDDKVQAGIAWTMRQWGETLGLKTWDMGDGSESVEGDVGAEIHTILVDAGLRDPETNEMAALCAQPQARAWGWGYEICTGCSASLSEADIKAGGNVACCPDRRMVTVRALVDAYETLRVAPAGPYRAEFGAIHHEGVTGFIFSVTPADVADEVARALNIAALRAEGGA